MDGHAVIDSPRSLPLSSETPLLAGRVTGFFCEHAQLMLINLLVKIYY